MKFNKKILANGLTVIHEERDVPVSTVMLAAKFGAAYETAEEKGVAHFIEHLCFKGTEKRNTKQIASEIEKVGGVLNAFTSEEITAYYAKVPSDKSAVAAEVIFDIFFNPTFPEEEIKRESQVICEEIKMYKDNPQYFVMNELKTNLYEAPFGMDVIGNEKNVRGFDRDKILKIHREIYSPKNSIFCVVGRNSFEDVLKLAEKFSFEREFVAKNNSIKKPLIRKTVTRRAGVEQANLAIGFHFPLASSNERYAAEIFNAILGSGMSSRLFSEVREKRGLAYAVKSHLDLGSDYGYLEIFIGTDKDKVDEVTRVCVEEFSKMSNITDEELEDGKQQLLGNKKVESEESQDTAVNLVFEEIVNNSEDYYDYDNKILNVKLADVVKLSEIKDYSVSVLIPQDA